MSILTLVAVNASRTVREAKALAEAPAGYDWRVVGVDTVTSADVAATDIEGVWVLPGASAATAFGRVPELFAVTWPKPIVTGDHLWTRADRLRLVNGNGGTTQRSETSVRANGGSPALVAVAGTDIVDGLVVGNASFFRNPATLVAEAHTMRYLGGQIGSTEGAVFIANPPSFSGNATHLAVPVGGTAKNGVVGVVADTFVARRGYHFLAELDDDVQFLHPTAFRLMRGLMRWVLGTPVATAKVKGTTATESILNLTTSELVESFAITQVSGPTPAVVPLQVEPNIYRWATAAVPVVLRVVGTRAGGTLTQPVDFTFPGTGGGTGAAFRVRQRKEDASGWLP